MAINLSDLTNASTSGDILAEAQTTADFLDSVPLLKNLADPSGATDGKQFTATKQPTALPLTKDSNGVLGGYLYQPNVLGNAPAVDIPTINANEDFVLEMEVYLVSATSFHLASGVDANNRFAVHSNAFYFVPEVVALNSPLSTGASTLTVERSGGTATLKQDGVTKATATGISSHSYVFTHLSFNGQYATAIGRINGYIKTATLSIEGTEVLNIDFTSPRIPHGASNFTCETGQVVTVNTSGNNPAKVIKKAVLRYDGVDDFMDGVLGQTVTGGYMFAAFSVLGNGGDGYARIFATNTTGGYDGSSGGFALRRNASTSQMQVLWNGGTQLTHSDVFNGARGDLLLESPLRAADQNSKINDADADNGACSIAGSLNSEEFNIASGTSGDNNPSIDLEYLALFPATLTDKQADQVRNYINNRNNVFYRWDTDGYYFFDPQKATFTGDFSASNTLDGYIIGSDNGDTDVRSDLTLEQAVIGNAQPSTDGYKITFSDNAEYLNFTNGASQTLAGWQVVGTSLGTFVYKVNDNAISELNLLGNLGGAAYRQAGDLYGIILLPESATNRDIQAARKLLINRGASDGVSVTDLAQYWRERSDIVEFKLIDTSLVTNFNQTWRNCSSLTLFPAEMFDNWNPVSIANNVFNVTWDGCSSLISQSVENILVSIAASGKYATTNGASEGTALNNATIDIDYDGSGLTAATTTAITTLKLRGWGITINGDPQ